MPVAFGPFEVNAHTGELRKRGVRVRLSGQPFQILLLLLARPGNLVTRDELREQLWSDGTFVDSEHGLNAAINKLRRALGDAAERPHYIETLTGRGYRFIGTIERPSDAVSSAGEPRVAQEEGDPLADARGVEQNRGFSQGAVEPNRAPVRQERRAPRPSLVGWSSVAVAVCLAAVVVLAWHDHYSAGEPPWKITRLTADAGMSDDPALSPDGALVAYASDRNAVDERDLFAGGLDLY
ncbi:MAG: winged helix-turn-helix domain-containing protein, partial [Acidobacteria bacterium]|nr:winged helix-turn-helix domain-containing protein [Acidobacteriota bacterium]